MIKLLTLADLKSWVDKAAEFHAGLNLPGVFNSQAFLATWKTLLGNKSGFVFGRFTEEVPREVVGVMVYPDPFTGEKTGGVVFWYEDNSQPGLASGYVLTRLHDECKSRGIKRLFVSVNLRMVNPESVEMLRKLGYMPIEQAFWRDI